MKLTSHHRERGVKLELSMTSMIDVVFLLLIFFLVTTTFLRPERQLKPTIKISEKSASRRPVDLEPAIVDVIVQNGSAVFRLGTVVTSDVEKLEQMLQQFENKEDGAFIRVADEVPFGMAAQAIGASKRAGFLIVSYVPLSGSQ